MERNVTVFVIGMNVTVFIIFSPMSIVYGWCCQGKAQKKDDVSQQRTLRQIVIAPENRHRFSPHLSPHFSTMWWRESLIILSPFMFLPFLP